MASSVLSGVRIYGPIMAGLLLVGLVTSLIAGAIPGVSALLVAIVLGAMIRNICPLPRAVAEGVAWASKKLLRIGIVLLGLKLSLLSLVDIGFAGVLTLLITVAVTFLGTIGAGRVLGVSRGMRMLIATGFSICGASAVAAMSGVVDRDAEREEDTAQAVALVTIFGTLTMFLLPALVPVLGFSDVQAGIWVGSSVHEVAQVVAAGGMISTSALAIATVAKLGRVVLLAPLIAAVGVLERNRMTRLDGGRPPIVPLFVAGFLLAVLVRTFVPLPEWTLSGADFTATLLLVSAMLGLGYGVDVRQLLSTGWRPFALGAVSTAVAVVTSLIAILMIG